MAASWGRMFARISVVCWVLAAATVPVAVALPGHPVFVATLCLTMAAVILESQGRSG